MARVGEVLHGRYRLDRQIGQGGFAQVFLGADLLLQRYVAIKILNPDLIEQAGEHDFLPRFMTEARAAAALNHPHILTVHDYGQADHLAYLVMPYIDGGTLHDRLRARQPLDVAVVGKYLRQVASALDYAHQRRLVHRDIKPQNMLLRADDDYLFLTDFGIVKVLSAASSQTRTGIMGTVAYMAPEQIRGAPPVSHRTDLYTLGCVMFEMLTGKLPFTCDSTAQMLYHHLGEPPPRVSSLVMDCPVWLDHLVNQLLEKDPLKRPHDASAVAQALREVQEKVAAGAGMAAHAASGGPSALTTLEGKQDKTEVRKLIKGKKKKKGKKTPFYERAWFLAACLLLTIGLGAWLLRPASESKLFAQIETMMANNEAVHRYKARELCQELLERFPQGEHAGQARQFLDSMDMEKAERRLADDLKHGRKPATEGARLFAEAWNFEQFGDRVTALEKYQGMVDLLPDDGNERPFVNLARRQIAALTGKTDLSADRAAFLEARLNDADKLNEEGKIVEARSLWSSIVTLYGDNRELLPLVKRAQQRLADDDAEAKEETAAKAPESTAVGDGDKAPVSAASNPPPEQNHNQTQKDPPIEQTGARDAAGVDPNGLPQPVVNRPYRTRRPRAQKESTEAVEENRE